MVDRCGCGPGAPAWCRFFAVMTGGFMMSWGAVKKISLSLLLVLVLGGCSDSSSGGGGAPDATLSDVGAPDVSQPDARGEDITPEDVGDAGEDAEEDATPSDDVGPDDAQDARDTTEPQGVGPQGVIDEAFAAAQPTPGLFVGPDELRADPTALMAAPGAPGGPLEILVSGRGRLKSGGDRMYSMRFAADGELVGSYGNGGIATLALGQEDQTIVVLAGALQPDGKSLVCGNVRAAQMGRANLFVARLNPDGSPDPSFGADAARPGRAYFEVPDDAPNSLCWAVQPLDSGKILVAGQFAANNKLTPLLMRLDSTGQLDTDFGSSLDTSGVVALDIAPGTPGIFAKFRALRVLDDQKILALVDAIDTRSGSQTGYVVRYGSDGRLDTDFGGGGQRPGIAMLQLPEDANHEVFDFEVSSDARHIFVVGQTKNLTGAPENRLFVHALDANGQVDAGFATGGTFLLEDLRSAARALAVQSDGKLLVAGSTIAHSNEAFESGALLVLRLGADGALDSSFASDADTPGIFMWEHPEHTFYVARAILDAHDGLLVVGSSPEDSAQSPRGHQFIVRVR